MILLSGLLNKTAKGQIRCLYDAIQLNFIMTTAA